MPSVLFVCRANRFRSPLAAGLFTKLVRERGLQGWEVASAGTWTTDGLPPVSQALQIASKWEIDISQHRSRSVCRELLDRQDLIVVMERSQKEALCWEFRDLADRIFTLAEIVDGVSYDIADPIEDDAVGVLSDLKRLIETGFENLCLLAQGKYASR
ncbi:MAG: hypothetical protein QXZ28_04010 [Candidatus Methanomethylicaceae archaeon]